VRATTWGRKGRSTEKLIDRRDQCNTKRGVKQNSSDYYPTHVLLWDGGVAQGGKEGGDPSDDQHVVKG